MTNVAFIHDSPSQDAERSSGQTALSPSRSRLGYSLFLLLTAVLFIRPAEIFSALENAPIYQVVIILCLLTSMPVFVPQLSVRNLKAQPGAFCVVGLLAAIILSHLMHGDIYGARMDGTDFIKVLAYYFLLLGVVDSPARLRNYLFAVVCFVTTVAIISLLVYHGYLDIPALTPISEAENYDPVTGAPIYTVRLLATGVFSDPNDFSIVLLVAIMFAVYWAASDKKLIKRTVWLSITAILAYAFFLTRSRGGLLALLGGSTSLLIERIGIRRALPLAAIALPIIFAVGGRQTSFNMDDSNDTAQGRMELWRGAFREFGFSPLFGIGTGRLADEIGQVAHNSYVQAFAEMGLVGGTFFFGAIALPVWGLRKHEDFANPTCDTDISAIRPYIQAATIGYAIGFCSLTRCYVLPTYLVLGVAGVCCKLQSAYSTKLVPPLSVKLMRNLFLGGLCVFIFFKLFVRFFGN